MVPAQRFQPLGSCCGTWVVAGDPHPHLHPWTFCTAQQRCSQRDGGRASQNATSVGAELPPFARKVLWLWGAERRPGHKSFVREPWHARNMQHCEKCLLKLSKLSFPYYSQPIEETKATTEFSSCRNAALQPVLVLFCL